MSSKADAVAFLTGASRGIGREIALKLASAGIAVFSVARSADALSALESEIRASGGAAASFSADVGDAAAVKRAFDTCISTFGEPAILINNAGLGFLTPVDEMTDLQWDATLRANLTGMFHCVREAVPLMKRRGSGHIINMASIAARTGFPGFSAYCAAKAGVLGFSRALREEVRPHNIRVSVLMPGATDTAFWTAAGGEWDRQRMMASSDIASVVLQVAQSPSHMQWEEVVLMPQGGVL